MAEVPELKVEVVEDGTEEVVPEQPSTIEVVDAEFAILIYKGRDGNYVVSPEINVPVEVERQATTDELKASLNKILDDIRAQETAALTAQLVVQNQMAMAMQMQRAREVATAPISPENQRLLERLPPGLAR